MLHALHFAALIVAQAAHSTSELDEALAVLAALDAAPASADYRAERLDEILHDLNGQLDIPINADWNALGRLGIDRDDRITFRLAQASGANVLAGLCLTIGDEIERPIIEVHAGQAVFTTVEGSASMRLTAAYDVRDLLARPSLVQRLLQEPGPKEQRPADGASERTDPEPLHAPDPAAAGDSWSAGQRLLYLLTDHIDPEAWMNFGGDRGRISDVDGVLMVTATPTTHRALRHALRSLRRADPATAAFEAAIFDLPRAELEQLRRDSRPGSSELLARALRAPSATRLWHTENPVAMNRALDVESTHGDLRVHVMIAPRFDPETGLIAIDVSATCEQADDRRSARTTIGLTTDDELAVMDLPAAKPGETARLLIVVRK